MPKFFTKYTPPKVLGFSSDQPSKVQEQFADACQTDTIIRKYNMMGVNPQRWLTTAEYVKEQRFYELDKNPDIAFYNKQNAASFEVLRKQQITFFERIS